MKLRPLVVIHRGWNMNTLSTLMSRGTTGLQNSSLFPTSGIRFFPGSLLSLPQGDSTSVEGVDDEHPITLPDIPTVEFKDFLKFFYFG
ncbi:hypothetical protein B0F90DRAFT_1701251, partial [Multifurca ochricompacta]